MHLYVVTPFVQDEYKLVEVQEEMEESSHTLFI